MASLAICRSRLHAGITRGKTCGDAETHMEMHGRTSGLKIGGPGGLGRSRFFDAHQRSGARRVKYHRTLTVEGQNWWILHRGC